MLRGVGFGGRCERSYHNLPRWGRCHDHQRLLTLLGQDLVRSSLERQMVGVLVSLSLGGIVLHDILTLLLFALGSYIISVGIFLNVDAKL